MEEVAVGMKCLYQFEDVNAFLDKVKDLEIEGWGIYDLPLAKRLQRVKDIHYFCKLKADAKKMGLEADDAEIVSWLDTMNYMYYVLDKEILGYLKDDIQVVQELVIPLTKKRADYVLFSNNKILIIEFSFNRWKKEYWYESKLKQVSGYKELLASLLPKHIVIATYTVLLNAEYGEAYYDERDTVSKYTGERIMPNTDTQTELAAFITKFFNTDVQRSAMTEFGFACGYLSSAVDIVNAVDE